MIDHPAPSEEDRHRATSHPLWSESWYFDFHDALLTTPRPLDEAKIKAAAIKAGVDWDRQQKDLTLHEKDIEDLA